eukprot:GEMP01057387.1.p1 GENE.GEMP01057387.1~~GEMP01057387.1.p1  ORF type:complete len:199 (+),score=47.47 GEMP01057387.1:206-802(+)
MPIAQSALKSALTGILEQEDLAVISLKAVREKLSQSPHNFTEDDILEQKSDIKAMVHAIVQQIQSKQTVESAQTVESVNDKKVASPPSVSPDTQGKKRKLDQGDDMTRRAFFDSAPENVDVDFQQLNTKLAAPLAAREFSTGSCGWYGNSKFWVKVADRDIKVQAQVTLICIDSICRSPRNENFQRGRGGSKSARHAS